MKWSLLSFLFLNLFCVAQSPSDRLTWLEGEWKMDGQEAYEIWQKQSDTTYAGGAFHQQGNEFVRDEDLQILLRNDTLFYIPVVYGKQKTAPVFFRISLLTPSSFRAENPNHDFPQVIIYELISPGRLHVRLEGPPGAEKTKPATIKFTRQ